MKGRRAAPPADPTDVDAAWEAALRRLARQPLPRTVLGQRLRQAGYAAETIAQVLLRAQGLGYLDDQAYADAVVRRRSRTRGAALIAHELRAKGIDDAEAARALEQLDPDTEDRRALLVAQASIRQRPPATNEELRRRIGAALGRRGFRTGTIVRTIARLRAGGLAGDAEVMALEPPDE